jgi:hypothetical protein
MFYVLPFALGLGSVDRYAFPVYPLLLVNLIAVPILIGRMIAGRRLSVRVPEDASNSVKI